MKLGGQKTEIVHMPWHVFYFHTWLPELDYYIGHFQNMLRWCELMKNEPQNMKLGVRNHLLTHHLHLSTPAISLNVNQTLHSTYQGP